MFVVSALASQLLGSCIAPQEKAIRKYCWTISGEYLDEKTVAQSRSQEEVGTFSVAADAIRRKNNLRLVKGR